jgi:TFIIH basal transcription factor complex TTD-A subunit
VDGQRPRHATRAPANFPLKSTGVLVECDESIRAIILKIDAVNHDFIIEDLDDHNLVVKETKLPELKRQLEEVGFYVVDADNTLQAEN